MKRAGNTAETRAKTHEQRFHERYEVQPNGCWLWTMGKDKDGYGNFHVRRSVRAHRFAYELMVGPIPEGMQLDHLCNTPSCVNPDHLEPVTCEVNLLRSVKTWGGRNARKTHCPQGHSYSGDNLRVTPTGLRHCLACKRIKKAAYDEKMRAARQAKRAA